MTTIKDLDQWYADGQPIIGELETGSPPPAFYWPTDFHYITRDYGARPDVYKGKIPRRLYHPNHWHDGHEGIDIRTGVNGKVYAIAPGEVFQVGWRSPKHAYGYAIRIEHEIKIGSKLQKMRSVYAHLKDNSSMVQIGDAVGYGEYIADSDSTGNATGDHLHLTLYWWFESLNSYRIVNPMWILSIGAQ